jgi:hypothetical protein
MTAIQPRFKLPPFHRIIRLFQNRFKLRAARHGKGIVKLKRDELCDIRRIEVRQKSTLMPTAKALFQFFNGRFPIPCAFRANKFEQAEILRRHATNWFR